MKRPLAFFFALLLVGFALGCMMGCSSTVNAPSGKYHVMSGSMKPLSDYKRVVIMPVKNETGHSVDSTILRQVFNVSRRTFLDSGLFHEVNGMTEPYFDEAGSDVVYVVPVLFSVSDKPKASELTLEYAFDDRSEGIRIASLQVVGRGGDVGLDAAVQSVGTGLSRALLSQVNRNSVSSASDGARRYY